ncbi:MAG: lipoate--protein ligase family protein [Gemmataceae bacterium]
MPAVLRLLPFEVSGGPEQMAADDLLLDAATSGTASLRFYGWDTATLSLGYFQAAQPAHTSPALASLPWLRRRTGGAALVHHHELTYALALPPDMVGSFVTSGWIVRVHQSVQAALAEYGIVADLCAAEQRLGEVLCFLHHTPGDLVLAGHKIAGSAQRKQRGALLQHGGILLAQSEHTLQLPGLTELTGRQLPSQELAARIIAWLEATCDWQTVPTAWTASEQAVRPAHADRYRDPAWNHRR